MRIAITGGTGTVGREVARVLGERGHEVRALARRGPHPVDLRDGSGLAKALDGVAVVVDATNALGRKARPLLIGGAKRLLAAEREAGVRHHVAISIVGIERAPGRYYALKVEQEALVKGGAVPWTIVRATQFHQLVDHYLRKSARYGVVPAGSARFQPVNAREVARMVADAAEAGPTRASAEFAGPEILTLGELAATWRRATGSRALPVPIPAPRSLRDGVLTSPDAPRGTVIFANWLRER